MLLIVIISISSRNNGFPIKDVANYFRMLKQFCMQNKHKFCDRDEIGLSKVYLGGLKNEIQEMIETESRNWRKEERERRRKLIKSKQIEQMLREHFLDRHI